METQISSIKGQNHSSKFKTDIKYRVYQFSLSIIDFVFAFPDKRMFQVFLDQLLRSGTSIGANIIEAKSSSSKREFIKYYEIALKSSNETKYWLCLLRDSQLVVSINQMKLQVLLDESIQISNIIAAALLTMKGKRKSG